MADDKKLLDKLRRLYDAQIAAHRDYVEKMAAIAHEVEALMGGNAGIGELLKRLERHYDATWCVRYAPGQTGRYVWNYSKDRAQWKRLIGLLGVEELELRVITYLKDGDDFYVKSRHPFSLFVGNVNRFASSAPSQEFDLDAPMIAGCKHAPLCTSDQEHTRRKMQEMRQPA